MLSGRALKLPKSVKLPKSNGARHKNLTLLFCLVTDPDVRSVRVSRCGRRLQFFATVEQGEMTRKAVVQQGEVTRSVVKAVASDICEKLDNFSIATNTTLKELLGMLEETNRNNVVTFAQLAEDPKSKLFADALAGLRDAESIESVTDSTESVTKSDTVRSSESDTVRSSATDSTESVTKSDTSDTVRSSRRTSAKENKNPAPTKTSSTKSKTKATAPPKNMLQGDDALKMIEAVDDNGAEHFSGFKIAVNKQHEKQAAKMTMGEVPLSHMCSLRALHARL